MQLTVFCFWKLNTNTIHKYSSRISELPAKKAMFLTQILLWIFFCNSVSSSRIFMNLWKHYSEQQEKQIQEPICVSDIWCLSKNAICLKTQFSTSFDITWYVEAVIYTKKVFFLSFHSL